MPPNRPLLNDLKSQAKRSTAWKWYKESRFAQQYVRRREYYADIARQDGLVYRESTAVQAISERLRQQGRVPRRKRVGEVHTFAFIPAISWHYQLLPDLRQLGPVTLFDYVSHGFERRFFLRDSTGERRLALNELFIEAVETSHRDKPIDWVFVYGHGGEVEAEVITRISRDLGIPTVNMCLDDKQSWSGPRLGNQRLGQIDIASAFDVSWTSARVSCEWYMAEGGRPLFMPEGCDAASFHPIGGDRDLAASFVGQAYGRRPDLIDFLRRGNVDVTVFGDGWRGAGRAENLNEVFNRSVVNLGIGDIGYSSSITNVKGRDFDVACAGGGVYVTSYNSDLARFFRAGEEMLCYRSKHELLEVVRMVLADPPAYDGVASRARARALGEHRWYNRYRRLCEVLGVVA